MSLRRRLVGRPPSWPEIAVAVAVTVLLVPLKATEPTVSSWPAAAGGFVAAVLITGPYAGSRLNTRVTNWFESAPVGRRWGVRLALVAVIVAVGSFLVSPAIGISIAEGLLFGIATVHWLQLLAFRTVVDHTTV